jgi:hypothetical protein
MDPILGPFNGVASTNSQLHVDLNLGDANR